MAADSLRDRIMGHVDRLNADQQRQVLDFTINLTKPQGTPGKVLLERVKRIQIEPVDLQVMQAAIDEEFEKVHPDEWDKPDFPA